MKHKAHFKKMNNQDAGDRYAKFNQTQHPLSIYQFNQYEMISVHETISRIPHYGS